MLLSIPCILTTSFISSPVLTPDLLRQGRLAVVLWSSAPHKGPGCARARTATCPGVWTRRSRDLGQAKQTCRSNVATGPTEPLSKGELWFPINTILLALTFSFPGSYILLTSCVLGPLFVTELRSLPDSKHLTVPLSPPPHWNLSFFWRSPSLVPSPWLLTGNPSALSLRTRRHWIPLELILIELCRIPLGMSSLIRTSWLILISLLVRISFINLASSILMPLILLNPCRRQAWINSM